MDNLTEQLTLLADLDEALGKVRTAVALLPNDFESDYTEKAVLALGVLYVKVGNAQRIAVELLLVEKEED